MRFASCDPGKTGAIAIMDTGCNLHTLIDMPIIERGKNSFVDVGEIMQYLQDNNVQKIVVEKVHSQAKDAKQAIFTFGRMAGALESACVCVCDDVEFITPQRWKRATGLIGTAKRASADKAASIYGDELFYGPRGGAKDGRGDAVMIGLAAVKLGVV